MIQWVSRTVPHAKGQAITQFASNKDFKNAAQFGFESWLQVPLGSDRNSKAYTSFHILKEKNVPYEEHQ